MVPGTRCPRLLGLAQRQLPWFAHPAIAPQCRRRQPFSTTLSLRQDPRHPPPASSTASEPAPSTPSSAPSPQPSQLSQPSQPQPPPSPPPTPPSPSSSPASPEPAQGPPPQGRKRRLAPRLLLALSFTLVGAALGSSARLLLSPPAPPVPGTEADAYATRVLHEQAAALPVVRQLEADPAWAADSWDAYASLPAEHRARHLSAGALAGSRGVGGYQRVWRHRDTGELATVVFLGSATAGWPGVVHGGCLATLLDESCGRAAFLEWRGRPGFTASLRLEYRRVTLANGFYLVRARARPEELLPERERGKRHYKCWVDATVEDPVSGAVTVAAEALFVGGEGKNNGKDKADGDRDGIGIVSANGTGNGGGSGEPWDEKAREAHLRF